MQKHVHGLELITRKFAHEKGLNVPWIPFAGIHAGSLKNYSAKEVLTDSNKLFESILEANKLYHPDGQPIVFDLQIEAEILGCELNWADKTPPSVKAHPLENTMEIPKKLISKSDGRIPLVLEATKCFKNAVGSKTAAFGLFTGPLTLASHLRGTSLFTDLIRNPDYAQQLIDYCCKIGLEFSKYYIEAGADVIASVDPVVSQISPRHFKKFLLEPYQRLYKELKTMGAITSFFVCGDATKNIELMCQTGTDSIFVDENIDITQAKQITDKYNVLIGGNIPLTTILLYGTQQDCMKYVLDILDKNSHDNLAIAPGCDMPFNTPPDNLIGIQQAIHESEAARKILENYVATDSEIQIEIPQYDQLPYVLIEAFTIDSASCAACGYMVSAGNDAVLKFGDKVRLIEYKLTEKENAYRVKKMGLKHLPAMMINGVLKFESIIPNKEELFAEIEKCMKESKKDA